MKILAGILSALILLIQYPLWLGKGGWLRAWHIENEVAQEKAKNGALEVRNGGLAAEVRDLKQGTDAIEERARYELGMVRKDEVFFQIEPAREGGPSVKATPPAQ
jgi:cell division protein FtsB